VLQVVVRSRDVLGLVARQQAQTLDARADYAEAAACLAEANALALRLRRQQGRHYDRADHAEFVDRLIELLTPPWFDNLARAGDDTCQPVFVFGMPRSGTPLVEQVLASHPCVHGAGELPLARQVFQSIPGLLSLEDQMQTCLLVLKPAHIRQLARDYRQGLAARWQRDGGGAAPDRVVDKMPDNYLYLGLLAVLFPQATFIHVRRDLRDVAVSCWMTNFRGIRRANDAEDLAGRIRDYRRLSDHWQRVLPAPIREVINERLVDDFETEARRLVTACGLSWDPACLQFHQTARPVRTASVTQVRQPLYRKSVARWKNYETALAVLFARLRSDGV